LVVLAPAAGASYFAEQRAAPFLDAMLVTAADFWSARNVTTSCTTVALDTAALGVGPVGRGFDQREDCRIVLDEVFLAKYLGIVYDERRDARGSAGSAASSCMR
jgi:hypothetical protein